MLGLIEVVAHRFSVKKAPSKKTPAMESLFNKVVDLQACKFIKKELQYSCFTVKFAIFQKNTFLYRTPPLVASEPN